MSYRQIEKSREIRLWISQIIVPAAGIIIAIPESREYVVRQFNNLKDNFKKKEEPK